MSTREIAFEYSNNRDEALHRAAAEWGVEREYWDIFGNYHISSADTEAKILASLGVDVSSAGAIDQARRQKFEEQAAAILNHTSVISESDKFIELSLMGMALPSIRLEVLLEDGNALAREIAHDDLSHTRNLKLDGQTWRVFRLPLPSEIPLGYHNIRVTLDQNATKEARLIVCPDRAYAPPSLADGGKTSGIAVTLWGLRSHRNWGCGDFTDLRPLTDWAVKHLGSTFIALNPLHIISNRFPYNTSPYLPLSIFFRNFIYIDIESVPEFVAAPRARCHLQSSTIQREIEALRASEYVEYERVSRLKLRFLKLLYRQFRNEFTDPSSQRVRAFRAYVAEQGELLEKLALFQTLDEHIHKQDRNRWTWRDWPSEYQEPNSDACNRFAREHRLSIDFYKYVQFVADEQLAAAQDYTKERGMLIGLYHDLALATDNCGGDLWAHRNFYVDGCRVGSPPDAFAPNGQDWAFPPPNTIAHRANGYQLYRESIRKIVRFGGALRIDHVMRLFRLFWIPDGVAAANGVYVKDNVEDLLHILALESVRSRNIIVGEDLGTVTDEMRRVLAQFGILSYRLLYFEKRKDDSYKESSEYPHQALVSSTTHDLATLAGFWLSRDINARRNAGLLGDDGYHRQLSDRRMEKQRMLDRLHAEHLLPESYGRDAAAIPEIDGPLHNAIVGFLAQTPSELLLLNQEDLTKETEQQNLPGSTSQYPNWRRKMKIALEDLHDAAAPYAAMFRYHMERTGRI